MARSSSPARAIRLWLGALLLSVSGTAFAADGADPAQPMLMEVTLNGQPMGEPWLVLRDAGGGTWLSAEQLRKRRLRLPRCDALKFEGESFCRIDRMASMKLSASEADQSLAIDAEPRLFERQSSDLSRQPVGEMTPSGTGAFMNYDLLGETVRGDTRASGAFEAGVYTRHGVGTSSFVAEAAEGGIKLLRLETGWTIDRPGSLSSIRIGDAISRAGPHTAPVRFAGIQYGRSFAVQPGFVTMPLPGITGSATVPSVVDIYVNNALRGSQTVTPGPFDVSNVPVTSGGGSIDVVTRDMLGREVVTSLDYYAAPDLLQRRLHDFSYEIGFERRRFGHASNSYGAFTASMTHRYGLSDQVTLEAHLHASRSRQATSARIMAAWTPIGLFSLSAAASRSRYGLGTTFGASFERRTQGLSMGARSELTSSHYTYAGLPAGYEIPRMSAQAFADLPLGRATIGVNILHRTYRGRPDESLAGLSASLSLGRLGAVQLYARRAAFGGSQTSVGGSLVLSLGGRRSASIGHERRGGGSLTSFNFQASPPTGTGSGVRVAATRGAVNSIDAGYRLQTGMAAFGAEVAHANGATGLRLSAAGAIGTIGGHAFASRALGDSFAAVKVADHEGVRVYADNQLIGKTGRRGMIMLPALRAYEDNRIRIDEGDLPLDVQLAANEVSIRPYARSGAMISFATKRERGVLLSVTREDGSFIPAGSEVRIAGDARSFVAVSGGEIYVPDLVGTHHFRARHRGATCSFEVTVPDNDDPQPRIGGLICMEAPSYAAR